MRRPVDLDCDRTRRTICIRISQYPSEHLRVQAEAHVQRFRDAYVPAHFGFEDCRTFAGSRPSKMRALLWWGAATRFAEVVGAARTILEWVEVVVVVEFTSIAELDRLQVFVRHRPPTP